ncbi:MAG: FMN-binding protein, partial [Thermoguttaceae bacterium]|nr:FMN-binding protein [Thermoguttaceae bacterium]
KGRDGSPEKNEIRALTGATISSQSVCDIVNSTLKTWREELK